MNPTDQYWPNWKQAKRPKPNRHKWISQDGFQIDKCKHCCCTRKWDDGFKRIIYYTKEGNGPFFWAPSCKRIIHCDVITKN